MATSLEALRKRIDKTGKVSLRDVNALLAVAETFAAHGHPLTCKGCRDVLDAAKGLMREQPALKSMGKAGGAER